MNTEAAIMVNLEAEVRQFARTYPTPNVQHAVALCEAGTLSWEQVAALFATAFETAKTEV